MSTVRGVIVLTCLLYLSFIKNIKSERAINVEKISHCSDQPKDATMTLKDIKLTTTKHGTNLYMLINLTEPVDNDNVVKINLKRCKNLDNLDSCENWSPIRINNFCSLIQLKNQPWSKVIENANLRCPIKKGLHTINGTYEFGNKPIILPIPIDNSYWIGGMKIYSKNNILKSTICFTCQIRRNKL